LYLLYLDDSGSAGNADERYFVLGGVSVFERQVHWLCQELETRLAEFGFPEPEIPNIELRATNILTGKNRWRRIERARREQLLENCLGTIHRLQGVCRVFAVAVDKKAVSPEDPVAYAFEQLTNRFDRFLLREHRRGNTQRGLIILDNCSDKNTLRQLASSMKRDGHRWGDVRNIADVPLFVDSKATRTIQYADLVAHAVWRKYEKIGRPILRLNPRPIRQRGWRNSWFGALQSSRRQLRVPRVRLT